MLTSYQVVEDIKAFWKHLEWLRIKEESGHVVATEIQHRAIFHKPQPFEFAKLEQWEPSKHRKR